VEEDLTQRQRIIDVLKGSMLTAREISKAASIREKDVLEHLPHVARSLAAAKEAASARFVSEPSECISCGFVFRKRDRLRTPSRCPVCRSEEITEMRFGIITEEKGS
jgi:transcriptional regulator